MFFKQKRKIENLENQIQELKEKILELEMNFIDSESAMEINESQFSLYLKPNSYIDHIITESYYFIDHNQQIICNL